MEPSFVVGYRVVGECLTASREARLIALACGSPPAGRCRWTLRLLADKLVELGHVEKISHETIRRTLKKTS